MIEEPIRGKNNGRRFRVDRVDISELILTALFLSHPRNVSPSVHYFEQRTKARVEDLLVSEKGSIRDKLRLLGVYCLAIRPSTAEVIELENLLKQSAASSGDVAQQEAERGLGAISYLRQQVGRRGRQIASSWIFPWWVERTPEGTGNDFLTAFPAQRKLQATLIFIEP